MPPMPPMEQEMPPMGGNDMPQGDDMMPDGGQMSPDVDDNPKKKIQQKAGKISNELSSYQGEDKIEVAKYVKGMIDKAADNIIDGDGGEDEMPQEQPPMGPEPQMESVEIDEDVVSEIVNDILGQRGKRDTGRGEKKVTNKKLSKGNPFLADR